MSDRVENYEELELYYEQIAHFENLKNIFSQGLPCAIDVSETGAGKSYITIALAIALGLKLFVVAPKSVCAEWSRLAEIYGVEVEAIISYDSLRMANHAYLVKTEAKTAKGETKKLPVYKATKTFEKEVENGILLVFDEAHKTSNVSQQTMACSALARAIISNETISRCILLSATYLDRVQQIIVSLHFLGFIQSPKLFTVVNSQEGKYVKLLGLQELIDACEFLDKEETERCVQEVEITDSTTEENKRKIREVLPVLLFRRVVFKKIIASMPPLIVRRKDGKPYDKKCQNVYFNIPTTRELEEIRKAVNELITSSGYTRTSEDVVTTNKVNWDQVTTALKKLEFSKKLIFVRAARSALEKSRRGKVIIAVHYLNTVEYLKEEFQDMCEVLTGDTQEEEREEIIRNFQKRGGKRILIMTVKVGGVGLSFHDIHGNSPRTLIASLGYSYKDMHQLSGRIYRRGVKSDAHIICPFANAKGCVEVKILKTLAEKKNIHEMLIVRKEHALPGEYEDVDENGEPVDLDNLPNPLDV